MMIKWRNRLIKIFTKTLSRIFISYPFSYRISIISYVLTKSQYLRPQVFLTLRDQNFFKYIVFDRKLNISYDIIL